MTQILAKQFIHLARAQNAREGRPAQTLEEMIEACGVGYFSLTRPKHWEAHYEELGLRCTGAGRTAYHAVADLLMALNKKHTDH